MSRQLLNRLVTKCITSEEDLVRIVAGRPCARIQTVNLHHLALAKHSPEFRAITSAADFVTADGWPIVSALMGLGTRVQRVTGSEFTQRLLTDPRLLDLRIGLLGATSEAGDQFASKLSQVGQSLVYRNHGSRSDWVPANIAESLANAGVELLLVAVTPPYGEEIAHQIHQAGFSGTVMAVGGAVDMLVEARKPAPTLIKRLNSEWAFRLVQEPRRLFSRYILLCLPVFITDVLPVSVRRFLRK